MTSCPSGTSGCGRKKGRSEWAAIVRKTRDGLYGVTLERGYLSADGKFVWRPELMLSWDVTTPEQARAEAAKAVSRMTTNLLVIGAGLRRDLDEPAPAEDRE